MERLGITVTRLDDEFRHDVVGKSVEEDFGIPVGRIGGELQETGLVDKELASHVRILSVGDKRIWNPSEGKVTFSALSTSTFLSYSFRELIYWIRDADRRFYLVHKKKRTMLRRLSDGRRSHDGSSITAG